MQNAIRTVLPLDVAQALEAGTLGRGGVVLVGADGYEASILDRHPHRAGAVAVARAGGDELWQGLDLRFQNGRRVSGDSAGELAI